MTWDVGKLAFDLLGRQVFAKRTVTYKKQADGKWTVESGDAAGTPSLDDIVSPQVPDTALKGLIMANPCGSGLA